MLTVEVVSLQIHCHLHDAPNANNIHVYVSRRSFCGGHIGHHVMLCISNELLCTNNRLRPQDVKVFLMMIAEPQIDDRKSVKFA